MTNGARIEAFNREGKRLMWGTEAFLFLRFPAGEFKDSARSRLVLDKIDETPFRDFPKGVQVVTASWTSIDAGTASHSRTYRLTFQADERTRDVRLI